MSLTRKEVQEVRLSQWTARCPLDFRAMNWDILPCGADMAEKVMAWEFGPKGILMHGVPRTGKTRLAWMLLRKIALNGVSFTAYDSIDFGSITREAYADGNEREFYRRLIEPDVLFIDDLGKAKITERGAEAIFGVVDKRKNRQKPCMFTMNYTGDALIGRIEDKELGNALLARLRECCEFIHVKKKDEK